MKTMKNKTNLKPPKKEKISLSRAETIIITLAAAFYGISIIAEIKTEKSQTISSAIILFAISAFFISRFITGIKLRKYNCVKSRLTAAGMLILSAAAAVSGIYWILDDVILK